MTRYEKIISLSLNDMANFLSEILWDSNEPSSQEMYEWLSEPYFTDEEDVLYVSTDGLQKQLKEACKMQPHNDKPGDSEHIHNHYNPVYEAYAVLVKELRSKDGEKDIYNAAEEAIGFLGEALE